MQICVKCANKKEDTHFHFRSDNKSKRRTVCIECCRSYSKNHYRQHKALYIKRAKAFNKKQNNENRFKMLDFLKGKQCVDCGNDDIRVLEFDHRDNVDKKGNIGDLMRGRYCWNSILIEIAKCDIRCANCHRIRTMSQFDNYKNCGIIL